MLLINGRVHDVECFPKPPLQLVLPLNRQRRGAKNEYPVNRLTQFHLLDQQTSHDRFAGARIVGQKEWRSVDDTLEAAPAQKEVRTRTDIPAQKVAQATPTPGRSAEVSGSHENPNQEVGKDAH